MKALLLVFLLMGCTTVQVVNHAPVTIDVSCSLDIGTKQ